MTTNEVIRTALNTARSAVNHNPFSRPTGSRVLHDGTPIGDLAAFNLLMDLNRLHRFHDVTAEASINGLSTGKCLYFKAQLFDGFVGEQAVMPANKIPVELLERVRLVPSSKAYTPGIGGGLELVIDGMETQLVDWIHIIVGDPSNPKEAPTTDSAILYTWYPGHLTANVELWNATVKLGVR